MNRKKKINQIYKNRMKKQNAKLHTSNKPRYISKADRAKMEAEEAASEVLAVVVEAADDVEAIETSADVEASPTAAA
ncbi:DUF2986 domain-containing protein [Vibrio scophthalmi]|uniref:DUF2986 domain-containing protein n=1 Tax=Vibrio scophthalmi LMG 19158 TaxID=870967 RepID=F9RM42_9VIBR|nr:DUF2986 domain-containing protein [Vibrio scophthalmi]EGU38742.1 hypothetical protein VIS19158_02995 [Vibrio scophthalmi LMG 19158]